MTGSNQYHPVSILAIVTGFPKIRDKCSSTSVLYCFAQGVSPRVWLFSERCTEFFKNEAYVASTRVEYMEQLGVVTTFPLSARQAAQQAYEFG